MIIKGMILCSKVIFDSSGTALLAEKPLGICIICWLYWLEVTKDNQEIHYKSNIQAPKQDQASPKTPSLYDAKTRVYKTGQRYRISSRPNRGNHARPEQIVNIQKKSNSLLAHFFHPHHFILPTPIRHIPTSTPAPRCTLSFGIRLRRTSLLLRGTPYPDGNRLEFSPPTGPNSERGHNGCAGEL